MRVYIENTNIPGIIDVSLPATLFRGTLQSLIYQPAHHLLEHCASASTATFKVRSNALLHVLAHHVDLDVHILSLSLLTHNDLLLRVGNEHHLQPALVIVDGRDGERCSVQRHKSLLDNVPQNRLVPRLQTKRNGIAILPGLCNLRDGVDMSLHEMASHSRVRTHGSLEVHTTAFFQTAQVGPSQRLRCNADFELVLAELSDCEAGAIDADAVAKVRVDEDLRASGYGQAGAAATAGGFVMLHEARDGWLRVSAAAMVGGVCWNETYCLWSLQCQ